MLTFSFEFSLGPPVLGRVPPTVKVGLSASINPSYSFLTETCLEVCLLGNTRSYQVNRLKQEESRVLKGDSLWHERGLQN